MKRFWHSSKFWYQVSAVLAVMAAATIVAGCALPTWLSDANAVLPEVVSTLEAILSIVALFAGKSISATEQQAITAYAQNAQNAITSLEAMVSEYNQSHSTTVLGNIEAAAQAFVDNATQFLASFRIVDAKTQTEIVDFITLALTQIKAWATLLPTLTAKSSGPAGMATAQIILPLDKRTFAANFNAILASDPRLASIKRL